MDLTWYNTLNKPAFTPPTTAFFPVWTILYVFIIISGILVIKKRKKINIHIAMRYYISQIVLNLIWSPVFFSYHQIGFAFIIILTMWYFIYKTIKAFEKIDMSAAILLYPYLLWVTIATLLNLSILLLN